MFSVYFVGILYLLYSDNKIATPGRYVEMVSIAFYEDGRNKFP